MATTVLILAATSKVPFYVAGGALAGWAVLVSLIGISRPGFPGSRGPARVVMAISVILVAAAAATAVITSGGEVPANASAPKRAPAQAGGPTGAALALTADPSGNLSYDKKTLTAAAGKVTIALTNQSPVGHNVTIAKGGTVVAATKTFKGATQQTSATLAQGSYVFFCSVAGHRQGGMQGTLTVR